MFFTNMNLTKCIQYVLSSLTFEKVNDAYDFGMKQPNNRVISPKRGRFAKGYLKKVYSFELEIFIYFIFIIKDRTKRLLK